MLSSFIKGECSLSSDKPLRILKKHMTGTRLGKLCKQAEVPPLIQDFERQCARFGIRSRSAMEIKRYSPHFPTKTQGREQIFKQDGISSDRVCQKDKGTGSASGKRPEYDAGNLDLPLQTLRSSSLMDVSVRGAVIEEAVTSLVRRGT